MVSFRGAKWISSIHRITTGQLQQVLAKPLNGFSCRFPLVLKGTYHYWTVFGIFFCGDCHPTPPSSQALPEVQLTLRALRSPGDGNDVGQDV